MKKKKPGHQSISNKIFYLIEEAIEHRLFKPVTVSIITSFILFNSFGFLESYLKTRRISAEYVSEENRIKINIPDSYYGFSLNQNQTVQRELKPGDTLLKMLLDLGANEADVFSILNEMKKVYDPRLIRVGDEFTIKHQVEISYSKQEGDDEDSRARSPNRKSFINSISFSPAPEREIEIIGTKDANGVYVYTAKQTIKKLTKQFVKHSATIKEGLYVDGTNAGISPKIMINMINLYSFDVDFQRDIRDGDKFEVLYESYYDEQGNRVKDGEVLFAALDIKSRKTIDMYLHKIGNRSEYFDAKGSSVRKTLLKTPIDGARITSKFGKRRHPILGYTKMHQGIDFGAPTGTPIRAAGSGTIVYYGRKGGYGNFTQIKHNAEYSTAYAHASRFVKGLRVGSKVSQGQIIAYVGTTGRSTGPHLHYELMYKGRQINPSSVKSTSGLKLSGKELARFMDSKAQIDRILKNTPNQNK